MDKIYFTTIFILCLVIAGCSYPKVVKLPRPQYPIMLQVSVSKDGSIDTDNRKRVVENIVNLSELIDNLYLCPCWED